MFGYVRPLKGELKVKDYERYKAIYCGLCHALGKNYGLAARFTVSYDLTFLSALYMEGENASPTKGRCVACPLKGKTMFKESPGIRRAARVSVILTWFSLKDKRADGGIFAKLGYGALSALMYPAIKKARKEDEGYYRLAQEKMEALAKLESHGCDSIDRVADCFASLLSGAAPAELEAAVARPTESLLYNLGRYVYILDAYDDYPDDQAIGAYNPLITRYGLTGPKVSQQVTEQVEMLVKNSLTRCAQAINLLEMGPNRPIIENIIYLGLNAVWNSVKSGTFKKQEKKTQ